MSQKPKRPIRFFCTECGKELWTGMDYEMHEQETLGEILRSLKCSDCILKDINEWR